MKAKRCLGWMVVLIFGGALAIILITAAESSAQGTQCPPGFIWIPNSGVGCVQENCASIAGAKNSYTGQCICEDGFKACYEGIDYSGFDSTLCGPFCPNSILVSCIAPEGTCPQDETTDQPAVPADPQNNEGVPEAAPENAPPGAEEPAAPAEVPNNAQAPDSAPESASTGIGETENEEGPSIEEMTRILEESLIPNNAELPSRARSAAGAMVAGGNVLLFIMYTLTYEKESLEPLIDKVVKNLIIHYDRLMSDSEKKRAKSQDLKQFLKPGDETIRKLKEAAVQTGQTPKSEVTHEKMSQLQTEFHRLLDQKVKEGHYVINKDFLSKAWNWPVSFVRDPLFKHTGGQCGEMAHLGQGWIEPFVLENFGREAIIDQIFVYERSSRHPQSHLEYVDGLYVNNHAATRVILPNGESYILDFWEGITEREGKNANEPLQIKIVPENVWTMKWRAAIGSPSDEAEVSNINAKQALLQDYLQQAGALHPYQASFLPPDQQQEAMRVTRSALEQWRQSRAKISPVETNMLIRNWEKYGMMWESKITEAPKDPASAFWDAGKEALGFKVK